MEYASNRCYHCHYCDKKYSSRQNLWKHTSKKHKTSNPPKYAFSGGSTGRNRSLILQNNKFY